MTDRRALFEQNETPEDVATLYSWANLHGAKYRDFSSSRAQTREKARERVQEAIETERQRAREEADAQRLAEARLAVETAEAEARREAEEWRRQEIARQEEMRREAEALRHAELAAQQSAEQEERLAAQYHAQQIAAEAAQQRLRQQAEAERSSHQAAYAPPAPPMHEREEFVETAQAPPPPPPGRRTAEQLREETGLQTRAGWTPAQGYGEPAGRPAWLGEERVDMSGGQAVPSAPEDTLQGSRDRLASRWFALKGVFETGDTPAEAPAPSPVRVPVVALFSLAGGVGKTSLVATLGRALSARGERVLLVDTTSFGLLPFYFGARDQRPGVLRTFSPPGGSGDAPLQMLTVEPETLGPENAPQEVLTQEIVRYSHGVSRVILDLATASGATTRRVLRLAPTVIVPVVPDLNSVVSVSSIDAFFRHNTGTTASKIAPFYVLNQFDATLPLHLDVREVLREQLGERLLPLTLRRSPAVSEALAEGMTVMDYAPNSTAAEDIGCLAGWIKSLAAPASGNFRGVRWSER
jgi:cellulose synthase operon protein YhjQ